MSYILDALKKSEEERSLGEVPKVASAKAAEPATKKRRSPMPWMIGALVIFNGALLIVFLSGKSGETPVSTASDGTPIVSGKNETEHAISSDPTPVEAPGVLSVEGPPPQESIADLIKGKKSTPSQILPRPPVPASEPAESVVPSPENPILASEPPVVAELIREELAARERRNARRAEEQRVPVPEASVEVAGKAATKTGIPEKESNIVESPPENFRTEKPFTSLADETGTVVVSAISPVGEAEKATRSGTSPVDEPEMATLPGTNPVDGESRVPESSLGSSAVAEPPLLEQMPADFRQRLPKLPINVYVYAEAPERRFILINMRKYREGSVIDTDLTLETIGHQSIILEFQGRRFRILRP